MNEADALLARVEEGLEGTTPGPWVVGRTDARSVKAPKRGGLSPAYATGGWISGVDSNYSIGESECFANAAHIALMHPGNVRAILDAFKQQRADMEVLVKERDEAIKVLREHHEWHTQSGSLGLPDGEGGWIEIDNAAEYGDSRLYQRTVAVLDQAPPVFKPIPRGGRASNHWENWQLAYREMKAQRKRAEALEAQLASLTAKLASENEECAKVADDLADEIELSGDDPRLVNHGVGPHTAGKIKADAWRDAAAAIRARRTA